MVEVSAVSRRSHPARTLALWLDGLQGPAPLRGRLALPVRPPPLLHRRRPPGAVHIGYGAPSAEQTPAAAWTRCSPQPVPAASNLTVSALGAAPLRDPDSLGGAEVDPNQGDVARLAGRHLHLVAVGPPQLGQRRPEPDAGPGPRAVATQRRRVGGVGPLYCPSSTERWTASTW